MSIIPFSYKRGKAGRLGSIIVNIDGKPVTLLESSVNFNALLSALKAGAWSKVRELASITDVVAKYSNGRVKIIGDEVFYDGNPLHDALAKRIMDIFKDGGDLKPLTNFLNNREENPSETARNEIYLFLNACNLPITEDGCFLAYKVVRSDYKDKHTGKMDNSPGATPKMKREDCDPERNNICSPGLHFCSRSYISSFMDGGDRLMKIKVNPRDVVSIPKDYNNAKGRACEYLILEDITEVNVIPDNYCRTDGSEPKFVEEMAKPSKADKVATKAKVTGAKLTESDVLGIHKMLAEDFSYSVIGARYGVHRRTIERIAKGEAWKSVKPKAKPELKGGEFDAKTISKIRKLRKDGRSLQSLADDFECSRHRIEKICNH